MEILNLTLTNFRNFSVKKIVFDTKLTAIVGQNGAGKSNILEAITLLSGIRSPRVETDLDLVKFGKTDAKIEAEVADASGKHKLVINIVEQAPRALKSYFVDAIKKRLGEFIHRLVVVEFSPQDLDLVSGSPSLRRKHLDVLLSSLDKNYWRNISSYNKIISRRNKLLGRIQEGRSRPGELEFWDERLLEHGKFVSGARSEFFEFLNLPAESKVFSKDLSWNLKQSSITADKLFKNRERDIAAGVTLSGPQRDDFRFLLADRDLEYFGSRGEQRMSVLALKMAELEYFQTKMGTRPILALDDIFSELDWEHREAVLTIVGKQQTIITAAEKESVPKNLLKSAEVFEL